MTLKLNGTNSVAAPAYAGDDADTGLQCGTNELKLVTGGTARATVDSSGRLLVGTSSSLYGGNNSIELVDNGGVRTIMGRDDSTVADNVLIGAVEWYGNGGDGATWEEVASIEAKSDGSHATGDKPGRLVFSTTADGASSPTERLRITSDGTIRLGSGSPGIDFSQIQTNASGMSSETLDSYEEGTATIATFTGNSTGSNNVSGSYVKIGTKVFCTGSTVIGASTDSSITGVFFSLPFSRKSGTGVNGNITVVSIRSGSRPIFGEQTLGVSYAYGGDDALKDTITIGSYGYGVAVQISYSYYAA